MFLDLNFGLAGLFCPRKEFFRSHICRNSLILHAYRKLESNVYHRHDRERLCSVFAPFLFKSCFWRSKKGRKSYFPYSLRCRFYSTLSEQGRHPTTVFSKISVRRSKYCLEFSITWGRLFLHDRSIHGLCSFWSSSNKFPKIFWSLIFHIVLLRLGYFSLKDSKMWWK